MPSRQQLESALIGADKAGDVQAATMLANALKAGQYDDVPRETQGTLPDPGGFRDAEGNILAPDAVGQPLPDDNSAFRQVDQYITDEVTGLPGGKFAMELMSAANRGGVKLIDYVGPEFANMILREVGIDFQLPRLQDSEFIQQGIQGNIMDPGLGRDITRTAGEFALPGAAMGNALRTSAKALPNLTASEMSTGQNVLKQMGTGTPTGDFAMASVSGAGAEVGNEVDGTTGAVIGAITAPVAVSTIKGLLGGLLNMGKNAWASVSKSIAESSDEGASDYLAEAMIREGLTPQQVIAKIKELGPDAIPADIATSFSRLLREASNKIPQIEGRSGKILSERQAGQSKRLMQSIDDAGGYGGKTVEDEIENMERILNPQIKQLYKETGEQGIEFSKNLKSLFSGKSDIAKARKKAEQELINKRSIGEKVSNIDVIDATKRQLDDQIGALIRKGKINKAVDLIKMKNIMVSEADSAIPVYKEARNLYAGKKAMENAVDLGEQIFKMKARDVQAAAKTLSKSELKMFKLGAKRAILDNIDNININSNLVQRLFGKTGDVKKLRVLFDNNKDFNKFQRDLKREATFILTRNKARGNSTTAEQTSDLKQKSESLVFGVLNPSMEAAMWATRLAGKRGSAATEKAYEKVGDILLNSGMDKEKLKSMLEKGAIRLIERELRKAFRSGGAPVRTRSVTGGAIETARE